MHNFYILPRFGNYDLGTILQVQKPGEALIWIVSLRKYYISWHSLYIVLWTFCNVKKFWDLFTGARDDNNNINKNSRQDNVINNSSNNNNKKTLEDFQNCGIISRQEPKEIQSPVRVSILPHFVAWRIQSLH